MKVAVNQSFESLSRVTEVLALSRRYGAEITLLDGKRCYSRSKNCRGKSWR